jgi:creatinine amidohydrolase
MGGTTVHFADLSWTALDELRRSQRAVVLLLPVGATEPHGPHAPLGTDRIISSGVCERVGRRLADDPQLQALVLPPLAYGVTRYAGAFAGAVHVDESTLRALLVDICSSLADQGFPHVMVVNSHFEPEHVQTIHAAIDALADAGVRTGYLDLTRKERARRLTEEFKAGECHAGRYETSLVLAERPELVDDAAARSLPYVPVAMATAIADGVKEFRAMGLAEAYCGSPAEASAAEGEETFDVLAAMVVELARDLVAGTGGRDLPGLFGRV